MIRFLYYLMCIGLSFSTLTAADFWQPVDLYGGTAQAITFAPNGDICIGSGSGGIFSSSDNGASWTSLNHQTFYFQSLAYDNEGGLWGTRWAIPGLVYSADNGKTWIGKLDTAFEHDDCLLVLPDNTLLLTKAIQGMVLRSVDRGTTWTTYSKFALGATYVQSLAFDPADSSAYVGVEGFGVFRSRDQGRTWQKYIDESIGYDELAVLPSYLVAVDTDEIYLARKGEQRFEDIYSGNGLFLALATMPDSTIIAGDNNGYVVVSHDLGKTWDKKKLTSYIRNIQVSPEGVVVLTSNEGVFRSFDRGDTWESANTGILSQTIQTIFPAQNGLLFAANDFGEIFRSTDKGKSWNSITIPLGGPFNPVYCMTQTADGTLYAGTSGVSGNVWGRGVYSSYDEGISWQQFNNGLKDTTIRGIGTTKAGTVYVGTERAGVFRLKSDKSGWEQTNLTNAAVWSLLVDSSDNIFAGAAAGKMYRSKDAGANWSFVQLPTAGDIQSIAQAPDGTLYAVSYDGPVYYSEDGGDTWHDAGLNKSNEPLLAVAVDKAGQVYVAGHSSFVRREKHGTWEDITGDVTTGKYNAFYCLAIAPDGTPFMGTQRGVFRGGSATSSVSSRRDETAQMTVFPNPANAIATIECTLAAPMHVELTVFNSLGEKVETVVQKYMEAGTHVIPWTTNDVVSGLYYCRLTCGSYSETRVITVMK